MPYISLRDDREVPALIELIRKPLKIVGRGNPLVWLKAPYIEHPGILPQYLPAIVRRVLMEIRHRELARRAVYGIAVAKHRVIRLTHRTPQTVNAEKGDDMIVFVGRRAQIHQKWRCSVIGERRRRE